MALASVAVDAPRPEATGRSRHGRARGAAGARPVQGFATATGVVRLVVVPTQLTLALVQIQSNDLHGPWPPGVAPRTRLLRRAWFGGVLAIQRGDLATGRRAAAFLDSARSADSVVASPLADGLRAELALALDSGAVAESLLVEAITDANPRPPARYRWLLARRYAGSDEPALAMRLAHSLTMPGSWSYQGDMVLDQTFYYVPALRIEGEMLERLGRRDEALARYREFVELRAGADPALQSEVAEVRARITRLTGAGGAPPR
jgi:hypothetical protein